MNYEKLPDYETRTYIMQIRNDQLWPYTPHFRKVVAFAIEDLFKTKITSLGANAATMEQTLIFVDDKKNRWIMRVEESSLDEKLIRIFMYFPQSNSMTTIRGKVTLVEHLIDTDYLKENNLAIITEDINHLMGRDEE